MAARPFRGPGLRRAARPVALGLALVLASAAGGGAAWAEAPVALVIGNSDYGALPKLPTCDASANLMAAALTRAGFRVVRQSNPSNARMGTAVASVGEDAAAAPGSASLIYLCGYALTYEDRLFVLPAEARLEHDADVLSQGIVARQLMGAVAGPGAAAGLVLMDVAPPPGKGPLSFASMFRPADAAHGGLAAAALPVDAQRPAALAAVFGDLVRGKLEVGALLRSLKADPELQRTLLVVQVPAEPSWLLGGPPAHVPAAAAVPPVPAAPLPPAVPAPAAVPVLSPPSAPLPVPGPAIAAGASALADPSPADRRRLQLALQRLNYFHGRIDGVIGVETQAAIRRYQAESNAEPTGQLTEAQVEQLLK